MIISKIKKTKYGYNVYFDEEVVHIELSVFLSHKLRKNQTITLKQFKDIISENETAYIKRRAVIYVAKARSVYEFVNYLKGINAKKELINELVKSFLKKGYLDDREYASSYVSRYENKYGKNKLRLLLKNKGISEEIIEDTLKNHIDKNLEFKVKSLAMRVKKDNYKKTKETITRTLVNLGYEIAEINPLIDKYLKDNFNEYETIKPHYEALKRKNKNTDFIINSLLRKGFNYEVLKKIIEEDKERNV
jgi:regulatory protein